MSASACSPPVNSGPAGLSTSDSPARQAATISSARISSSVLMGFLSQGWQESSENSRQHPGRQSSTRSTCTRTRARALTPVRHPGDMAVLLREPAAWVFPEEPDDQRPGHRAEFLEIRVPGAGNEMQPGAGYPVGEQ